MKTPRREGFLLMEAALAVAVLAVGLAALFRAFSMGLNATRESRERLEASLLLEGRAWEVEKLGDAAPPPPPGDPLLGPLDWGLKDVVEENWTRREITLSWGPSNRRNDLTLAAYADPR